MRGDCFLQGRQIGSALFQFPSDLFFLQPSLGQTGFLPPEFLLGGLGRGPRFFPSGLHRLP